MALPRDRSRPPVENGGAIGPSSRYPQPLEQGGDRDDYAPSEPVANYRIPISAQLEPDCDNDGFGDETQDQDLNSCPPAPETTITKHPKDKTKKKTATFEFTANEPAATFECSIDGGPFTPCSSPDRFKVKTGKHSFVVRAKDAGNNVEGTPASDAWKVKKRKRK